jgi:hypothetical protein
MKKFVIFTLIIAMAAGAAFAQTANGISVNAWGRGAFVPLAVVTAPQTGGEVDKLGDSDYPSRNYAGVGPSWGWSDNVRTDFRVNGNADFVGFQIQLNAENPEVGDNMDIWAKPFISDILKLSVGKFQVDNLRGKLSTDTGFENFVLSPMDEDAIFTRFWPNKGFMLSSEPVDGLFIGLGVTGALSNGWEAEFGNGGVGSGTKLMDTYRTLQFGFGYDIADVGHIRAQWVGGWFGTIDGEKVAEDMDEKLLYDNGPDPDSPARIEAAFALTSVQNLLVDLGLKFWLPFEYKDGNKYSKGIDVNVGARFRADAFQIVGQIGASLGSYTRGPKDDDSADGISLAVNLIPSYDLDAFTIGASIGLQVVTAGKDAKGETYEDADYMALGLGAFASKGLGSGSVKAGLAFKTAPTTGGKANGSGIFSIPIILEYAFF